MNEIIDNYIGKENLDFDMDRNELKVLSEDKKEIIEKLQSFDPFFGSKYIEEFNHVVFMKFPILDAPNIHTMVNNIFLTFKERPCVGERKEGKFIWKTYSEFHKEIIYFSIGMTTLLEKNSFVGISTEENRSEYHVVDFNNVFNGFVSIGLQSTRPKSELQDIIQTAELSCIVCDGKLIEMFTDICKDCPTVKYIISIDDNEQFPSNNNIQYRYVSTLKTIGKDLHDNKHATTHLGLRLDTPIIDKNELPTNLNEVLIKEDNNTDMNSILFTSGSTGRAKGCIITKGHWRYDISDQISHENLVVEASFNPSTLGADRVLVWGTLLKGGRVGYCKRGVGLFEDLSYLNPTNLLTPPTLFSYIYNEFTTELKQHLQQKNYSFQEKELLKQKIAEKYSKLFGNRLNYVGIGGAKVSPDLLQFIKDVMKIKVIEGFGTSESGGIASDGKIIPSIDYKLIDVPEMGYLTTDKPFPRGELLVKTSITIPGYFKNEEETKANFTEDGYYITGDIVEIDPETKFIKVIDRKKNLFKLAISEFVSPTKLEQIYENIDNIKRICVYGDSLREYIIAIVLPNACSTDEENVKRNILLEMRKLAKLHDLRHFEIPKSIIIDHEDWTIENNMLTPSFKISRFQIYKKHMKSIEEVYNRNISIEDNEVDNMNIKEEDSIANKFLSICKSILSIEGDDIDTSKSFTELGGTSMGAVKLLFSLRRILPEDSDSIPIHLLINKPLKSICEMIELGASHKILSHWMNKQNQELSDIITKDSILSGEFNFTNTKKEVVVQSSILLTGSTGFLGSHLLHDLLKNNSLNSESKIYCIIRGTSKDKSKERLLEVLRKYKLLNENIESLILKKVIVLNGHLSQPQFGLTDEDLNEISNRVTNIYHVAARVEFSQPYTALKSENVNSVLNILHFIQQSKYMKILHYVSTISVFGDKLQSLTILNENESIGNDYLSSGVKNAEGYSVTKWVAEKLLMQAFDRGLNCTIYRVGLCSWSTHAGKANSNDWFTKFLQTIIQLKSYPDTNSLISLVPVDFVSKSIQEISDHQNALILQSKPNSTLSIYHIVNNQIPLPVKLIFNWLENSKISLHKKSYNEWIHLINESSPIFPLLPYIQYAFPTTPQFSDNNSQSIRKFKCPTIDQDYVKRLEL
ncbi:hypothetical protein ABK040_002363 [Willaertia magna]